MWPLKPFHFHPLHIISLISYQLLPLITFMIVMIEENVKILKSTCKLFCSWHAWSAANVEKGSSSFQVSLTNSEQRDKNTLLSPLLCGQSMEWMWFILFFVAIVSPVKPSILALHIPLIFTSSFQWKLLTGCVHSTVLFTVLQPLRFHWFFMGKTFLGCYFVVIWHTACSLFVFSNCVPLFLWQKKVIGGWGLTSVFGEWKAISSAGTAGVWRPYKLTNPIYYYYYGYKLTQWHPGPTLIVDVSSLTWAFSNM